jgi:hypothetical protein
MAIDFSSSSWRDIEAWANKQLLSARVRNDATTLSEAETQANRGEIRFIKKLLGLPAEAARAQQGGSAPAHPSDRGPTGPETVEY